VLRPTRFCVIGANVAQLVEHIHGKDEVDSSILSIGSFVNISFIQKHKLESIQTVLFLVCAWLAFSYMNTSVYEFGVLSTIFHNVNLIFHEAGHTLFMFFGEFLYILGGSLFQIIVPASIAIYFYIKKEVFAFSLMLLWVATNIQEVSIYMADAVARSLPLLGDNIDSHDWHALFQMMNVLDKTNYIAATTSNIAFSLLLYTVFVYVYMTWYEKITEEYTSRTQDKT
jgi:hypothetical protein